MLRPSASTWTNGLAFDGARRLETLVSQAGTFDYYYDSTRKRRLSGMVLGSAAGVTNSYESVARLGESILYTGSYLDSFSYAYDAAGRRTSITNYVPIAWQRVDLDYDSVGQLISAMGYDQIGTGDVARVHQKLGYAYDAAGNLTVRTNNALVQTFTPNAVNELSNVVRSGTMTLSGGAIGSVAINGTNAASYWDNTFALDGLSPSGSDQTFTAIAQDGLGRFSTNTITVNLPATANYTYDDNGNLESVDSGRTTRTA